MIFFSQKILFTPSDSTFVTNIFLNFLPFTQKIFLQTLVEIFFRYHKKYFYDITEIFVLIYLYLVSSVFIVRTRDLFIKFCVALPIFPSPRPLPPNTIRVKPNIQSMYYMIFSSIRLHVSLVHFQRFFQISCSSFFFYKDKNFHFFLIILIHLMVLILDGNSEHFAHARSKIGLFLSYHLSTMVYR